MSELLVFLFLYGLNILVSHSQYMILTNHTTLIVHDRDVYLLGFHKPFV